MTTFDLILVAIICLAGWQGWRWGFIGGALSLVGFIAGALLSARFAPMLLPGGIRSPWAPLATLLGAALGGLLFAAVLDMIAVRLRRLMPLPLLGTVDRAAGLLLGIAAGAALVWLAAIAIVRMPGAEPVRREVRASGLVAALSRVAQSPDELLGLMTAIDPLPSVTGITPVLVPPPQYGTAAAYGVRRSFTGVIRVRARACGFGIEGSGWSAGSGLYVTNAHVVAGDGSPKIESADGGTVAKASVSVFDRINDIAILRSDGLGSPALRLGADPAPGTAAAVLGFPLDGPFRAVAARTGTTMVALTGDAYGNGPVRRHVTVIRGSVRPGNSGGPLVDSAGRVIGTVFGRTKGGTTRGGFAVPPSVVSKELRRALLGAADRPGPCGR